MEWQYIILFYIVYSFLSKNIECINISFIILSLSLTLYYNEYDKSYLYFSLTCRLWEFSVGQLCYSNTKNRNNKSNILFLVLVFICFLKVSRIYILTYLLMYMIVFLKTNHTNTLFNSKILMFIGDISYSLYLVHYPVIQIFLKNTLIPIIILSLSLHYIIENVNLHNLSNYKIIILYFISTILLLYLCYRNEIKYRNIYNYNAKLRNFGYEDWAALDKMYIRKKCLFDINHIVKSDILLLGDSHLLAWFKLISQLNLSKHSLIMVYIFIHSICSKRINFIKSILIKKYNIIFISHYLKKEVCVREFTEYIYYISNYTNKVCIIQDTPHFITNPWNDISSKIYNKYEILGKTMKLFKFPIINLSNVKYFDASQYMCKRNKCISFLNGFPI